MSKLGSAFLNGIASKLADATNSYLYSGISITKPKKSQPYELANYDHYFNFLEHYHFMDAMVSILFTTVSEAIQSSSLHVSIPKDEEGTLTKLVNNNIDKLQLYDYVLSDLKNYIYRGKYVYSIDLDNYTIDRFVDPYAFKIVEKKGNIIGAVINNKFVNSSECLIYNYDRHNENPIPRSRVKVEGLKELARYETNIGKSKNAGNIVAYTLYEGKSIFQTQLMRIYQLYTLEYSLYMLGLRESIRPDILTMTLSSQRKDTSIGANAAVKIESILNQPSGLIGQVQDPVAFINELSYSLLNNIKVLPTVDNYSQINELSLPDAYNKRNRLMDEKQQLQSQILANLSIPEELYMGNGNRWEVLIRNDRYLTLITKILSSISLMIRRLATVILIKNTGKRYSVNDIVFNLETNNYMSTFMKQQKLMGVSSRLQSVEQILSSFAQMNQMEFLNKDKIKEFFSHMCSQADDNLIALMGLENLNDSRRHFNPQIAPEDIDSNGAIKGQLNNERRNFNPNIDSSMIQNGVITQPEDLRNRREMHPVINDLSQLGTNPSTITTDNIRRDPHDNRRNYNVKPTNITELL